MSDQGATAQAKDKVQEVAGQAQAKAQEAAGQARHRLRGQIDQRSSQAGERVSGHAQSLRTIGEQLHQRSEHQPAKLAEQAADRLERAGTWLTDSDADHLLDDVEDLARRNPWAVMAGGLALGFAASRLLKASSSDRYRRRSGGAGGASMHPPQLPQTTAVAQERFSRGSATAPSTVPPVAGEGGM